MNQVHSGSPISAMTIDELPDETLDALGAWRCDWFVEKHEGPWRWKDLMSRATFLSLAGYDVLIPRPPKHRPNITVQRCIPSHDGNVLTVFLKDTTYVDQPDDEFLRAGFLAVCDRFPDHAFYVASVYHEWFMVDNLADGAPS
jgi:hypothetical protein